MSEIVKIDCVDVLLPECPDCGVINWSPEMDNGDGTVDCKCRMCGHLVTAHSDGRVMEYGT